MADKNQLSITAHAHVACFMGASHATMLKWLKKKREEGVDGKELHSWWYGVMESKEGWESRRQFFSEVVNEANLVSDHYLVSRIKIHIQYQMTAQPDFPAVGNSPRLGDPSNGNIETVATKFYDRYVSNATQDLMSFISEVPEADPLCVTYWDEADELRELFWVIMRLLSNQKLQVKMWNIFMATKSSLAAFFPIPGKSKSYVFSSTTPPYRGTGLSTKLAKEIKNLLPPFISLGFDQNVIKNGRSAKRVTIDELQSIEHCCQYGRPM
jgi:hypothetical protein